MIIEFTGLHWNVFGHVVAASTKPQKLIFFKNQSDVLFFSSVHASICLLLISLIMCLTNILANYDKLYDVYRLWICNFLDGKKCIYIYRDRNIWIVAVCSLTVWLFVLTERGFMAGFIFPTHPVHSPPIITQQTNISSLLCHTHTHMVTRIHSPVPHLYASFSVHGLQNLFHFPLQWFFSPLHPLSPTSSVLCRLYWGVFPIPALGGERFLTERLALIYAFTAVRRRPGDMKLQRWQ